MALLWPCCSNCACTHLFCPRNMSELFIRTHKKPPNWPNGQTAKHGGVFHTFEENTRNIYFWKRVFKQQLWWCPLIDTCSCYFLCFWTEVEPRNTNTATANHWHIVLSIRAIHWTIAFPMFAMFWFLVKGCGFFVYWPEGRSLTTNYYSSRK